MTSTTLERARGGSRSGAFVPAALAFVLRVVRAALVRHRRRATLRELAGLDERSLKDIGLCRGDIYWVADQVAHDRDPRPWLSAPGEPPHGARGSG